MLQVPRSWILLTYKHLTILRFRWDTVPREGTWKSPSTDDEAACRHRCKRPEKWQLHRPPVQTAGRQTADKTAERHANDHSHSPTTGLGQGALQLFVVRRTSVHVPPSEDTVFLVHQVSEHERQVTNQHWK